MKSLFYFIKQIHQFSGKFLYINLMAMGTNGLMASLGTLLLIPLIAMTGIVDMNVGGNPLFSIFRFIGDLPVGIGFPLVLLFYVIIMIVQTGISGQLKVNNAKIQFGFLRHMQIDTYQSLLYANWKFYIKQRKSDLVNILTREVARASLGAMSFISFLSSLIFTGIQVLLAFILSPLITMFLLLCGVLLILVNRKLLRRSFSLGTMNFELGREYLAGVTDQINGIKDIKSNTLEDSRLNWFKTITNDIKSEQVEYTKLKAKSQLIYKVASSFLIATFIYLAVILFSAQAAELMIIIIIFGRLWPTVTGIQSTLEQIITTIPSFRAVQAIQQESRHAREFELDSGKNYSRLVIKDNIQCQNVFFRYHSHGSYALENINLSIQANQMTAIVGKSGAGKSTLIDMLMGLNQPEKGEVLLDGIPLSSNTIPLLRKSISYVPQDPFLFNASVRDNLLLVKPDATEEDIWEALEFSSAAEFIKKLPEGLDTVIGDRGIKLSGGERQRLVLARAILRKPSILILDEATSSLDSENEAKIQEALERLKGQLTIIVIAHRLSTIRNADQVVVLDGGEIVQKGGYLQLAGEKKSLFNTLLQKQVEGSM